MTALRARLRVVVKRSPIRVKWISLRANRPHASSVLLNKRL
jgi:hypothetical protein